MPHSSIIDEFLARVANLVRDLAQERIDEAIPKPPREPRRKNIKPPKVKTPKTPKPAKREAQGPTLYQILGVDAKAEPELIEAAWKAKARLYHPDRVKGTQAAEKMKSVNAAHDVLSDPVKRREYDANLKRETR